jgi:photosystem II stability/assembly factor-like uncharacterized protein
MNRRRMASRGISVALLCANLGWLAPSGAGAGVNRWTPLGPEGGGVCGLVAAPSDPRIVYAAGGSYFRSSNSGASWEATGAPAASASCLLSVDVADPLRLYALLSDQVLRSLDGGTSWQTTLEGLPADWADFPIAVGEQDPNLLMFAAYDRIYRSRDRGSSWQQVWNIELPPARTLSSTAIHPTVAGRVFAITTYDGVFVSDDYGDNWTPANGGLPDLLTCETIKFDPNDPSLLFLMTRNGLFRSRNGGETWSLILPASSNLAAGALSILPDSTLFSLQTETERKFLMRSDDGGDTWRDLGSPFPPSHPGAYFTSFTALPGGLLVAGAGITRSIDGGESWEESNAGIFATWIRRLALDRQNPERLYGATYFDTLHSASLLRSRDRGTSWQRLASSPLMDVSDLGDFLVDPNDPFHFLVTSDSPYGQGVRGFFSSEDGGESWAAHPVPSSCFVPTEVAIGGRESSRVFLSGILRRLICAPECCNWRSEDGGENWQCISPGGGFEALRALEPSPFDENLVLALGAQGLYRSTNSGSDWVVASAPSPIVLNFFTDVVWASASIAYASTSGSWLYESLDAGVSWHARVPFPDGVPARPWLSDLAVDPFHPLTIYALSREEVDPAPREVVYTQDGGFTWFSISTGLLGWNLTDLTLDPVTPNRLYVSAFGGGVLAYDLQQPGACAPTDSALCLQDGRFRIESIWRDFEGRSGVGRSVPLAADTGAFWFFSPENLELFVKEIDGTGYNDAFWTFYGSLTNVEFTVLATDTQSGAQHGYFNPSARFASRGDIESFPQVGAPASDASAVSLSTVRVPARSPVLRSADFCAPDATTLCLQGGRFAASVRWRDFAGHTGFGTAIPLTSDTGSFWFFDAGIHELAVKVIDGLGFNGSYWVFFGSLSNVEFELTVVDTVSGEIWTRANPSGTFASGGDIEAFPQLP